MSMTRIVPTFRYLIIPVLLGVAALAAFFFVERGETTPLDLGVSKEELAENNIVLSEPRTDYVPRIDEVTATKVGEPEFPDVAARDVVLGHLRTPFLGGLDQEVWVVSMDPDDPDLIPAGRGGETKYVLVFVDPNTGEVLFSISETKPPPGGWGPDVGPPIAEPLSAPRPLD